MALSIDGGVTARKRGGEKGRRVAHGNRTGGRARAEFHVAANAACERVLQLELNELSFSAYKGVHSLALALGSVRLV